MDHHSIPATTKDSEGALGHLTVWFRTVNLMMILEHFVNGLNGPNVVTKENNNGKGNVLVQEIVMYLLKRKEIVGIYQLAKERLVNGLNGPNVQQLVAKASNNAKGNVLVQEIVMV